MTTSPAVCLLLTQDSTLTRQLRLAAGERIDLRETSSRADWARPRSVPPLLLLDLRHPEAAAALAEADPDQRRTLIAFGVPGSEPFLGCHDAGLFAVEPLDVAPERLRRTLHHALLLHQAQEELSLLREPRERCAAPPPPGEPAPHFAPLQELWRASRHVDDSRKLLDRLVEGLSSALRIARVGVFTRLHEEMAYRMSAGLHCLDDTASLTLDPSDPFVAWLGRHAHLVCRSHLAHVSDLRERRMLQQMLDDLGAEIIAPLLGRQGLLGWIFVGHRITGIPFAPADLTDLTLVGEQVATLLENATLMEEIAIQKALAESLLEAIPTGIVAVSEEGVIRCFNRAAAEILDTTAAAAVNRPVERTCSRLADLVLRTLEDEKIPAPATWTDPETRRTVRADAVRIGEGPGRRAMLLLSDITRERLLHERQEELERHAFWNDLAAAMSHEVRNPLVAISTFAQLLPERHADADFRQQFFNIVTGEVSRLNAIITQINAFAHPPAPNFQPSDPGDLARQACLRAVQRTGRDKPAVQLQADERLPTVSTDADALVEALAHLLVNAFEAVQDRPAPRIGLEVRRRGDGPSAVLLYIVGDNGPGIPREVQSKLFSPFFTTKPRGLGLGLPLARRAAVDHGGRVDVASNDHGTTVTMTLPLEGRSNHAETPDC